MAQQTGGATRRRVPHTTTEPGQTDIKCGLCGTSGNLTKTECCGVWSCDDESEYVMFSDAHHSCHRNHGRYPLCASHDNEGHAGAWQECQECREGCETEMYVWYGTNEYNFVKLENPPEYQPTKCARCKRVIKLAAGGYSMRGGGYYCDRCSGFDLPQLLSRQR